MARYIDDEYDGVIVKLPRWFIDLNGLGNIVDKFTSDIEKQTSMSTFYGDYVNSLYELKNYRDKVETVSLAKQREAEEKERARLYYNSRINKDILDITWVEEREVLFRPVLYFGEDSYDIDDLIEMRANEKRVMAEVNDRIQKLTPSELKEFLLVNRILYLDKLEYGVHYRFPKNAIYIDNRLNPSIRYEIIGIKWYISNGNYYDKVRLNFRFTESKENLFFTLRTKKYGDKIMFNDYTVNGSVLEKKKK